MVPTEMLRISWTAKKSNETVLREADTTRSLINRIRKRQAIFIFWPYAEKKTLEHFVIIGMIKGKPSRGHSVKKSRIDQQSG